MARLDIFPQRHHSSQKRKKKKGKVLKLLGKVGFWQTGKFVVVIPSIYERKVIH